MRPAARILLIVLILAGALLACRIDGDPTPTPGGWQPTQGGPWDTLHATATYGAEQWHAQLTAIAETETKP